MRKTIGIDASPINREVYTGTEWYAFHLIEFINKVEDSKKYSIILYGTKAKPESLSLPSHVTWKILKWPLQKFWISGWLTLEMIFNPPDLLFVPANRLPLITPQNVVTTIHDIGFIISPEVYAKKDISKLQSSLSRILKKNAHVLLSSRAVENDLEEYIPELLKNHTVVPLSINTKKLLTLAEHSRSKIEEPYLLFIGTLNKKKNIIKGIKIFEEISKKNEKLKFVIIGKRGFGFEEIRKSVEMSASKDGIIMKAWVSEEEHAIWFNHASAFLLPSIHEGFGLPILEAQTLAVPLILSDIPVFHEISGEGALFIDINDVKGSANSITSFLETKKRVEQTVQIGAKNVVKYTPERTAEETINVITELLS